MPVAAARSLPNWTFCLTHSRKIAPLPSFEIPKHGENYRAWEKRSYLLIVQSLHVKSKLLRLQSLALSFHETLHSAGVGIAFALVNDRDET